MVGQYYAIEIEYPHEAAPGQLVFPSNGEEMAIGFIYQVEGDSAEIVLFEPGELPERARPLEMAKDYMEMLGEVLTSKASPSVVAMWREMVSQASA